ncbi:unnamed protein product [Darwinula stevensoni]|uniref:RING-type domain-containing protein n=1 Tax=Darwinula stevensoni TaxID=69355 RepID=A0A7R9A4F1_9CRUS|nr:unnamed protein product [Darwinula stevensoni]CAG0892428.1 unnamed protein product [Darwinula stevensoni]
MSRYADEPCLSLEAYAGLSQVFTRLGDFERGLQLAQKGVSISSSFQICDLRTTYTRLALLHLVLPLRKLQHLGVALALCKDVLKMCYYAGDVYLLTRCLICLGDVYRHAFDHTGLERAIHCHMESAYEELGDKAGQKEQVCRRLGLEKDLEMACGFCNQPFLAPSKLLALPCSHLFHSKCVREKMLDDKDVDDDVDDEGSMKKGPCPECGQSVSTRSRPSSIGYEEARAFSVSPPTLEDHASSSFIPPNVSL